MAVFLETKFHSFGYNIQRHGVRAVGLTWLLLPHHLSNGQFMMAFSSFDIQYVSLPMVNLRTFFCIFYFTYVSLKRYGFYFRLLILSCVFTPYARH